MQTFNALVVGYGQVVYFYAQSAVFRFGTVDVERHLLTHHHFRQLLLGGFGSVHRADVFALAKDGNAVGYAHYFVEFVRDYDYAFAVGFHCAQHGKQFVGFGRGQYGGRLVQNKDVCAAVQRFDYFHRLLFRHSHVVHLFVGVNVKAVTFAHFHNALFCCLQVVLTADTQHDVFRSGKHVHQLEVLVYHAYSAGECVFGRSDYFFFAVNVNCTAVGVVDACQHVHQGCFAAAVFAQHGKYFALSDVHRNVVVCHD